MNHNCLALKFYYCYADFVSLFLLQVKFAIQYMRRAIQKKAKFDIMDLNTIKVVLFLLLWLLLLEENNVYNCFVILSNIYNSGGHSET